MKESTNISAYYAYNIDSPLEMYNYIDRRYAYAKQKQTAATTHFSTEQVCIFIFRKPT